MEKKQKIETQIEECIRPILAATPYDIYDIEFVKEGSAFYLRIFIDKEDGIDLDDCEKVTDLINDPLDAVDPIKEPYYLEVSSPGIERRLKTLGHFEKAVGEKVFIKTYSPIDGKKEFIGILTKVDNQQITLGQEGEEKIFPYDKIAKANLSVF